MPNEKKEKCMFKLIENNRRGIRRVKKGKRVWGTISQEGGSIHCLEPISSESGELPLKKGGF